MSDFFGRLELELRAAAERPPRRLPQLPALAGPVAAVVVVAAALVPVLLLLGGGDEREPARVAKQPPVGTVIPKGEGNPPREANSIVVATGRTKIAGRWSLEVHRGSGVKDPKTGEVYLRAGGRCLILHVPKAGSAGGFCAPDDELGFRKTPGFSRGQASVPQEVRMRDGRRIRARQVLVYGVVPERASKVVVDAGDIRMVTIPTDGPQRFREYDFYVAAMPPGLGRARINWLDEQGRPGSRGIGLMPPITDR
jgi:hypothetical protein